MASETLLPDGVTSADAGWTGSPDNINLETNVDEGVASADGDTTNCNTAQDGSLILTIGDAALSGSFTQIQLRISAKNASTGGSSIDLWMQPRINSTGLGEVKLSLDTAYSVDVVIWTGSWTLTEINTLEIELRADATGMNAQVNVSAVEAIVQTSTAAIGQAARIQTIVLEKAGLYRRRPRALTVKRYMVPPAVIATPSFPFSRSFAYSALAHAANKVARSRARIRRLKAPHHFGVTSLAQPVFSKVQPPYWCYFVPPPKPFVQRNLMHTPTGVPRRSMVPVALRWLPVDVHWHPPERPKRWVARQLMHTPTAGVREGFVPFLVRWTASGRIWQRRPIRRYERYMSTHAIVVAGPISGFTLEECMQVVMTVVEDMRVITTTTACMEVTLNVVEDMGPS